MYSIPSSSFQHIQHSMTFSTGISTLADVLTDHLPASKSAPSVEIIKENFAAVVVAGFNWHTLKQHCWIWLEARLVEHAVSHCC